MQAPPLLSVCLITYNHAPFIRKALDSILMQQLDIPWEIIVADDCSKDGTREILLEYKQQHPDRIKLLLQKENVGPARNWLDLKYASKAKYIAYLEGDDYWTDPLKLRKQVEYLEAHPEVSLTCHNAMVVNEAGELSGKMVLPEAEQRDYTAHELMCGQWVLSCTICYRNVLGTLPREIFKTPNGDFFLFILLGEHGSCKFFHDIAPSHYRVHQGGTWSNINTLKKWKNQAQSYYWIAVYFKRKKMKPYVAKYADLFLKKSKAIMQLQLEQNLPQDAAQTKKDALKGLLKLSGLRVYLASRKQF